MLFIKVESNFLSPIKRLVSLKITNNFKKRYVDKLLMQKTDLDIRNNTFDYIAIL